MTAMLPCEYCGQLTPWDMQFCVPPCCQACSRKPLFVVVAAVLVIAAGVFFALLT